MMSLTPINRLRALDVFSDLTRQLERLFEEVHGNWPEPFASVGEAWIPPMDVVETDDEIRCTIEMPGVSKENLEVAVQDRTLRISGTKMAEHEEGGGTAFRRIERRFGRFARHLRLPDRVDIDRITANYENGVLTLILPKSESARARQIPVTTSDETK